MNTRPLDEFDKFLRWWADGLALIVPRGWRMRRQRFKQHLLVRTDGSDIIIEHYPDAGKEPAARHATALNDQHDHQLAQEWLAKHRHWKTLPTILRVAADSVLTKHLRYPAAVRSDLANVIGFDIDRQTPFSRDDVYFDYDEIDGSDTSALVEVALLVLPKREIAPVEVALEKLGLKLSVIDIVGRTFFEKQINLLPNPELWRSERPPNRLRFALFVFWLALIAMIPGKQIITTSETIRTLKAAEREGRKEVRTLSETRKEHARLSVKLGFFNQLAEQQTAVIELLNEATRILPDHTWIQRFDLKDGKLTLQGESDKASEIPGILESSVMFSSPRFSSPVTRNNANGKDRFQIVVAVDLREAS